MVPALHDHAEGHAERVSVEPSVEDFGDLQEAVLHTLNDQEEGCAGWVKEEQFAEDQVAVVHQIYDQEEGHTG